MITFINLQQSKYDVHPSSIFQYALSHSSKKKIIGLIKQKKAITMVHGCESISINHANDYIYYQNKYPIYIFSTYINILYVYYIWDKPGKVMIY